MKHVDRSSLEMFRALHPLGSALNLDMAQATLAICAELLDPVDEDAYRIVRDQAYGADARQRLDIFAPAEPFDSLRPVLLFVHGGAFVYGGKGGPEDPFYNNVGIWAVRRGFIGATMSYRLAPDAQWPAGAADVALAHDWLAQNIAARGGDPQRIVLLGHDAGAVHVAGYLAGHAGPPQVSPPAGAVLVSGRYDLSTGERGPNEAAYFGSDSARYAAQSSLGGLLTTSVPCLFAMGELEPALYHRQAAQLVQAYIEHKGIFPRLLHLPGHNHISCMLQLGSHGDTLGKELNSFIVRCTEG